MQEHSIVRSSLWFSDGNIVLLAGSSAFKVHRGQLGRHSQVFHDLFQVPQPPNHLEDMYDDCVCVCLHDKPSDLFYFLAALYDGLYFKDPRADEFPAVSAVLRMSTKYLVDHLRDRCLERLEMDWPIDLYNWDVREQEATDGDGRYAPRRIYAHPILVVELALDLQLPTILTPALYDLSRYAPSRIISGTAPPKAIDPIAPAEPEVEVEVRQLPIDLLFRVFRGRERAQQFLAKFVLEQVQHRRPSLACSFQQDKVPSRPCHEGFYYIALNLLRSIGGVDCGRDADPLYTLVQAMQVLTRTDIKLCHSCRMEFAEACANARQEFWNSLSEWFGIQDLGM